uniref:F-box domain-containing protein n=1 Tax=Timspurckia oligopyrenoides TaxID=708627 RepID=A0A7S0ZFE8_9RHOD|mmetsp:Transcript_320/g.582  ORF Transcript_320/g.582 Transcript_320/m.582 type:complete len:240 (+) Transcript_320:204-923(+)
MNMEPQQYEERVDLVGELPVETFANIMRFVPGLSLPSVILVCKKWSQMFRNHANDDQWIHAMKTLFPTKNVTENPRNLPYGLLYIRLRAERCHMCSSLAVDGLFTSVFVINLTLLPICITCFEKPHSNTILTSEKAQEMYELDCVLLDDSQFLTKVQVSRQFKISILHEDYAALSDFPENVILLQKFHLEDALFRDPVSESKSRDVSILDSPPYQALSKRPRNLPENESPTSLRDWSTE